MNLFKKFAETITAEFLEKPDTYMKFTKVLSGLWTSLILQHKETEKKKKHLWNLEFAWIFSSKARLKK